MFYVLILILFIFFILIKKNIENFSNDKNIILITQFYLPNDNLRKKEIITCLQNNLKNNQINKIILFGEKKYNFRTILGEKNLNKIEYNNIGERLSYKKVFEYTNNKNEDNSIYVLANSDIYFDNTLKNLKKYNLDNKFLALSRINIKNGKYSYPVNTKNTQDTWIWKNKLNFNKNKMKKFEDYNKDGIIMGLMGCDNYIAYMMDNLGYIVENKCKLINCFHLHQNEFREWKKNKIKYHKKFTKNLQCIE